MYNLILLDDDYEYFQIIKALLAEKAIIHFASNIDDLTEHLKHEHIDLVLLDLLLPHDSGFNILSKIRSEIDSILPVIILTGSNKTEDAVKAIKMGATDFLHKTLDGGELFLRIEIAIKKRNKEGLFKLVSGEGLEDVLILGEELHKNLGNEINRLATNNETILLEGETGTGKDLVAKIIHNKSNYKRGPFIKFPLVASSETLIESDMFGHTKGAFTDAKTDRIGYFEVAEGGTLYLPEISYIPTSIQYKILEFTEEKVIRKVGQDLRKSPSKKIDTRLIFATNKNLWKAQRDENFLKDLIGRISHNRIYIPPLRKRKQDIPLLADYFIKKHSDGTLTCDADIYTFLSYYDWPLNIRELEGCIRSACSRALFDNKTKIEKKHIVYGEPEEPIANGYRLNLEFETDDIPNYKTLKRKTDELYLRDLIEKTGGNVEQISKLMDVSKVHVYNKLKELGFKVE